MSKRKSRAWLFFDEVNNDFRKVKCNQCQIIISRGGQGKAANTSSMYNHIKYRHPTLVPQLGSMIKSLGTEDSCESQTQAKEIPTSTASTSMSSEFSLPKKKNQQNIEDSLSNIPTTMVS